jgi:hypothetical protein
MVGIFIVCVFESMDFPKWTQRVEGPSLNGMLIMSPMTEKIT